MRKKNKARSFSSTFRTLSDVPNEHRIQRTSTTKSEKLRKKLNQHSAAKVIRLPPADEVRCLRTNFSDWSPLDDCNLRPHPGSADVSYGVAELRARRRSCADLPMWGWRPGAAPPAVVAEAGSRSSKAARCPTASTRGRHQPTTQHSADVDRRWDSIASQRGIATLHGGAGSKQHTRADIDLKTIFSTKTKSLALDLFACEVVIGTAALFGMEKCKKYLQVREQQLWDTTR